MAEESAIADASGVFRKAGVLAGRYRWLICGLLFLGVAKNYMDRQVLGVLKGPLQHELGWNDIDYGYIVLAFQTAYALGLVCVGRLIDRLGSRIGYAAAWLRGPPPDSPVADLSPVLCLRFAVDDLKAYALEAAIAGGARPSSGQLGDWLWNETATGAAIRSLRRLLADSPDERAKLIANMFLVPALRAVPGG